LAIELAQLAGDTCALVDLQLEFGSVATYFDSRPAHTIADLTTASNEIDTKIVEQAMTVLPSNVAVLARPERVDQATNIDSESIASILKVLAQRYDSVVADIPCRFDGISITALEMASSVMLVLQLSVPSIRNAQRLYKALIQYGMPAEKILPVVNRSTRNSPISPKDVEEHLGTSVFAVIPNDYKTVQGALDFGRPLLNESPDSPVRKAIAQIARRLYKGDFSTALSTVHAKRKTGFLSRWLGS
jgi:pilus assembly protein CpaE